MVALATVLKVVVAKYTPALVVVQHSACRADIY